MASIEERKTTKGKSIFRVMIRKKGYSPIYKSFRNREDAELFVKNIEDSYDRKLVSPQFTLKTWIERYKLDTLSKKSRNSIVNEERFLKFWEERLGNKSPDKITIDELEALSRELLNSKNSHGKAPAIESMRKYLLCLGFLYNTAIKDWKWAVYNPVSYMRMLEFSKENTRKKTRIDFSDSVKRFKISIINFVNYKIENEGLKIVDILKGANLGKTTWQNIMDSEKNSSLIPIFALCDYLKISIRIVH